MKKLLLAAALGSLALLGIWARLSLGRLAAPPAPPQEPQRIVSLAPSTSETLYALGLGDKVAGVTSFCLYPPEAAQKPKVAGFSDINFEAVLRQRPDLVLVPGDKKNAQLALERLGLAVLPVDTRSLTGYRRDVARLGQSLGRAPEAAALLAEFERALHAAKARSAGKRPPRVLFAVMHSYEGLGYISEIYAVGRDGFYDELLSAAGGVNAYTGKLAFPRLSREAVIFLDPEVIIDVIPGQRVNAEAVLREWQSLSAVSAVKNGRIHLFTDEGDTVPGPRSPATLGKLSRAFHPND